jgi:predicted transcriptional regulator of viral defense system
VIRLADVGSERVPKDVLYRAIAEGELQRLSRGIYSLPGWGTSAHVSMAEVSAAVPQDVLCLLTAPRFHKLTTQNPPEVWVAIPAKARRSRRAPRSVRFVHLSDACFRAGVEVHVIDKVPVRIYSAAKTVADCFKFRNQIGLDVAVEALHDFYSRNRSGLALVSKYARVNRVARVIRPYLESMR